MTKVGTLIQPVQQLCYLHGIHLAVMDVVYKKSSSSSCSTGSAGLRSDVEVEDDENESGNDYEDNDDCEGDTLEVISKEKLISELSDEYKDVVQKVRKIVKIFRRSPTKNDDILQPYVKCEANHELQLILDCKTRWNSLLDMLSRFKRLRSPIQKAMIDLKIPSGDQLTDADFNVVDDLVATLEPVKIVVEALCRRDVTLVSAEAALDLCFVELEKQPSELAKTLSMVLHNRIKERRAHHSAVLQYLQNPNARDSLSHADVFAVPSSSSIRTFVLNML